MILYATKNRDLEVWYLDLTGALARPPAVPAVYALVSFESDCVHYYVGASRRLTGRLSAHLSFSRSKKLRGHSAGGQFLAPVVARRRRILVIILETCPGASAARLMRCEQAWILVASRDCGAAALPYQIPNTTAPSRGPHAPTTLAERRAWPGEWVEALGGFFRESRSLARSRRSLRRALNGTSKSPRLKKSEAPHFARGTATPARRPGPQERQR